MLRLFKMLESGPNSASLEVQLVHLDLWLTLSVACTHLAGTVPFEGGSTNGDVLYVDSGVVDSESLWLRAPRAIRGKPEYAIMCQLCRHSFVMLQYKHPRRKAVPAILSPCLQLHACSAPQMGQAQGLADKDDTRC